MDMCLIVAMINIAQYFQKSPYHGKQRRHVSLMGIVIRFVIVIMVCFTIPTSGIVRHRPVKSGHFAHLRRYETPGFPGSQLTLVKLRRM